MCCEVYVPAGTYIISDVLNLEGIRLENTRGYSSRTTIKNTPTHGIQIVGSESIDGTITETTFRVSARAA